MAPFSARVRRLLVGTAAPLLTAVSVVTLSASTASTTSTTSTVPPSPTRSGAGGASADHLVVQVRHAGAGRDGTYELSCHPGGGSHPDVDGACRAVERNTRWGTETFAPVPEGSVCTMQYGGPATARVTGTWDGRPVDAVFGRGNGCEIERWDRFVPLLPDMTAPGATSLNGAFPGGALPLPDAVPPSDAGALTGAAVPTAGIGPLSEASP
ncbi:hypothetical protein I3F60_25750 [Streptomyces sp. MUM 136J]|nr:hypothetical protein [Streptomyces sp. MUM 136J]